MVIQFYIENIVYILWHSDGVPFFVNLKQNIRFKFNIQFCFKHEVKKIAD